MHQLQRIELSCCALQMMLEELGNVGDGDDHLRVFDRIRDRMQHMLRAGAGGGGGIEPLSVGPLHPTA